MNPFGGAVELSSAFKFVFFNLVNKQITSACPFFGSNVIMCKKSVSLLV